MALLGVFRGVFGLILSADFVKFGVDSRPFGLPAPETLLDDLPEKKRERTYKNFRSDSRYEEVVNEIRREPTPTIRHITFSPVFNAPFDFDVHVQLLAISGDKPRKRTLEVIREETLVISPGDAAARAGATTAAYLFSGCLRK